MSEKTPSDPTESAPSANTNTNTSAPKTNVRKDFIPRDDIRSDARGGTDPVIDPVIGPTNPMPQDVTETGDDVETADELFAAMQLEKTGPAVDTAIFPGTSTGDYWSVTPALAGGGTGYSWTVSFNYGYSTWDDVTTNQYARCVR